MTRPKDQSGVRPAPLGDLTALDWVGGRRLHRVSLSPAEVLFRQGDQGDAMYLVNSGEVEIRTEVGDQSGPPLATLGPGAMVGELGLFAADNRNATVAARSDVELWEIAREGLVAASRAGEPWAIEVLLASARGMARRLSRVDHQLAGLMAEARSAGEGPATAKVAELEDLRRRLFSEWTF